MTWHTTSIEPLWKGLIYMIREPQKTRAQQLWLAAPKCFDVHLQTGGCCVSTSRLRALTQLANEVVSDQGASQLAYDIWRKHDSKCDYCDSPGGSKTAQGAVAMPINGRVCSIDYCIHKLVAALNAGGIMTVASCCGHNKLNGVISLDNGQTLVIVDTPDDSEDGLRILHKLTRVARS